MSATETESKSWLSPPQQPHHTSPFAWQRYFAYATKTHAKTYTCMGNMAFVRPASSGCVRGQTWAKPPTLGLKFWDRIYMFLCRKKWGPLTPLLQLQRFRCKFPKIRFFTYLPWMKFFKIWRKLLKFDCLHHYQYFILIFLSDKTWVDDFWPPVLARQIRNLRKNVANHW